MAAGAGFVSCGRGGRSVAAPATCAIAGTAKAHPATSAPNHLRARGRDAESTVSISILLRICDGDRLAAYGWYAFGATPIGLEGVLLHYSPGYVYMYKGFTHVDYRGQRLHAIGMTRALQHYLSKGYKGIVSYVESINFDSLKSCFRMGYAVFGTVYVVRAFGRYYGFSTPGCRKYAFRVERVAGSGAPGLIFGK